MNTPLSHILSQKGRSVTSVAPSATVTEAVKTMNQLHIGAVVVTGPEKQLLGIFTERDVLNRIVAQDRDPKTTVVESVMSKNIITVSPATTVDEVMSLFQERRVRHLPVIEEGAVVGMISIGDINRVVLQQHADDARHLRDYIQSGIAS